MKIKIKYHQGAKKIAQHGNWIDLFPRKDYFLQAPKPMVNTVTEVTEIIFDSIFVDLGISMKLPKYFEANMLPRSSSFIKQGVIMANSQGIIDTNYSGEADIWKFPAIALKETKLTSKKAITQFKIQPSMDAPWWIKLKWLFNSKINFIEVDVLTDPSRGGFGTSDK